MTNEIIIKNATTHNLKSVDVKIPKDKVVVFCGVSGSGKSSLVFDTIYTEAQRQLIETFSSFARRRLPKLSRPAVEEMHNLSTAIIIDQKRMGRTLRSTVGTATEIATYLRMLYSRCGKPFIGPSFFFSFNNPAGMCQECKGLGKRIVIDTELLINKTKSLREGAIDHPDYHVDGWNWRELLGSGLFDNDKPLADFTEKELNDLLFAEGIPVQKQHGAGVYMKKFEGVARKLERLHINKAEDELTQARKNAYEKYFVYNDCTSCHGSRINQRAASVTVSDKTLPEVSDMELWKIDSFLEKITDPVAAPLVIKIRRIIGHLIDIGAGYLSLSRPVATLSGGESQRVKMARQLDCDLVDLMYILDEPSIGLHPRDNAKLIEMLSKLKDKGNSVFVVEHDPDIIAAADWVIEVGPQAGEHGGKVLFSGTYEDLKGSSTLTARYLEHNQFNPQKRKPWQDSFLIKNASLHNLKNVTVKIPKEVLTCITGVAGSGKSSLIHDIFVKQQKDIIVIDQTPPGKSSRSNPATYIGIFDLVRKEIAAATNTSASLFSFNSKGACEKCKGSGTLRVEMNFLDDVKMTCDECGGKKFKGEVLEIKYKDKNIDDILNMTIEQAESFFDNPEIQKRLRVLSEVGLGYLRIGQSLSTLSGGEAQRIKLASELHKSGNTYVMDEPTTGLHMADIERFMAIVKKLVSKDNTVIVIEHNLDVIKQADWIIDMGPEGGADGGRVLFEGTPEDIVNCSESYTGQYLKHLLVQE